MQIRYKEEIFYDGGGKMLEHVIQRDIRRFLPASVQVQLDRSLTNLVRLMYLFTGGAGLGVL